ncbi:hypothetical protein EVAR_17092_1 [Eumeta japonica]|uniref:Uncharacterized protein n=1 Tax=Eumeta variegata TaxID=151549 RepID=A0A4C1V6V2_EUMVA|nr:hypothetical protein EVAR_17092_1 [Eumeta japonica]
MTSRDPKFKSPTQVRVRSGPVEKPLSSVRRLRPTPTAWLYVYFDMSQKVRGRIRTLDRVFFEGNAPVIAPPPNCYA